MIKLQNLKPIHFYLGILLLWAMPFFYYQDFYRDDYTRLVTGYAGWENAGRPLATFLYHALSLNAGWIYNLYPLPLFLSLIFLGFTLNKLHSLIYTRYNIPHYIIIPSLLLIICNPFYIQNMAYQYDVLPMSIAVSFAVLSFTSFSTKKRKVFQVMIYLFLTLGLYQPAINIFISLSILNFSFNLFSDEQKIKIIFIQGIQCVIAVSLYYLIFFILSPIKPIRSEIVSSSEITQHIFKNFHNLNILLNSMHINIFISLSILAIIFFIFIIKGITNFKDDLSNKKWLSTFLILFSPALIIFFIWGPLMFLREDLPFPRTYLTLGVVLAFISLVLSYRVKFFIIFTYLFIILSYLVLNSFCFVQHQQYLFENKAIERTLHRIGEDKKLYSTLMIFSYGNMPVSPDSEKIRSMIPYISLIQKPSYRWQSRFQMAILGYDYTNSMYTYKVADNVDEWIKICNTGTDSVFHLEAKTQYSDIFYDKNKKYTSIWFRDDKTSVCDKKPLEFDAE